MSRNEYQRTVPQEIVHQARIRLGTRTCDHNSPTCYCGGVNCTEFAYEVVTAALLKKGYQIPSIIVQNGVNPSRELRMSTTPLFDSGFFDMGYDVDWEEVEPGDVYFRNNANALVHMGIVEKVYKGWFNKDLGRIDPVIDGIDTQGVCGGVVRRRRHERRFETLNFRPYMRRNYRYNMRAIRIAPANPQTGWHEV